jgi:hypothetical protein
MKSLLKMWKNGAIIKQATPLTSLSLSGAAKTWLKNKGWRKAASLGSGISRCHLAERLEGGCHKDYKLNATIGMRRR